MKIDLHQGSLAGLKKMAAENRVELKRLYEAGEAFSFGSPNPVFAGQAKIMSRLLPTIIPFDEFLNLLYLVGTDKIEDEIRNEIARRMIR